MNRNCRRKTEKVDTVAAGCVISCSPGVGSEASKGTGVSLVISTGSSASGGNMGNEQ